MNLFERARRWATTNLPALQKSPTGTSVQATGERMAQITCDFHRQPQVEGYLSRALEETVEALLLRGVQPGEIFETVANALQAQADKTGVYISEVGRPMLINNKWIDRDLLAGELADMQVFTRAAAAKAGIAQWEIDQYAENKLRTLEDAKLSGALTENRKYGTPYKRGKK